MCLSMISRLGKMEPQLQVNCSCPILDILLIPTFIEGRPKRDPELGLLGVEPGELAAGDEAKPPAGPSCGAVGGWGWGGSGSLRPPAAIIIAAAEGGSPTNEFGLDKKFVGAIVIGIDRGGDEVKEFEGNDDDVEGDNDKPEKKI